jgi:drug/metabolite transporter (DMT)-like permease
MSGPALIACLVLTAVLAVIGVVLLARSHRGEDSLQALLGLVMLMAASIPAAVYGAASG